MKDTFVGFIFVLAIVASLAASRHVYGDDDEPACQCDASEAGYCNYRQNLNTTFNCRGTNAGLICADQIFKNVFNGTQPVCSCLATFCEVQPQAAKNKACVDRALDKCWFHDEVGCTDDDDNNDLCVWYCMQWYINDGFNFECQPEVRHRWTSCEKDCHKYIADPSSSDFDGTIYAECMYKCADPMGH